MSGSNNHPVYRLGFPYNNYANSFTQHHLINTWFKPLIKNTSLQRHTLDLPNPDTVANQHLWDFKKSLCFPWLNNFQSGEINKVPHGIQDVQYEANAPTEDRLVIKELEHKEGYLLGVFDGHGGGLLAEQASKRIHRLFQKYYDEFKKNGAEKKEAMKEALIAAFNALEQGFYERAVEQLGQRKKYKKIGSCAICCVFTKQFVIVANAGDSKAILVSQQNGETIQLNEMFNTNNQKQIARIKKQFQDTDILVTNSKNGAKYLKGCLIPTRCFGDFHLKYEQFAQGVIKFNKKYITHSPDIRIHEFKNNTKYYLVTGSDGLWDELNDEEISKTVLGTQDLNKADALIDAALDRIAEKHETTTDKIRELSPKRKREYHDDISIIVANLEQLY